MATITKPMALDESFNTTESTSRNQADVLVGIEQAIVRGFGQVANAVSYDNTDSGLTADNVQDAIDEVDDTVDGLVDDVAEISSDIESTQTVSGNPITLTDAAPINAESLVVELEPIQEGSGDPSPTNVRPITGYTECEVDDVGFNQWDEEWENCRYSFNNGTKQYDITNAVGSKNFTAVIPGEIYYFRIADNSRDRNVAVMFYDENKNYINYSILGNEVIQIGENVRYVNFYWETELATGIYDYTFCINISKPTGTPKNGDYVPYHSSNATIQFGQTVYGGKVDFLTGELTVDRASVDLGSLTWTRDSTSYSNTLFYADINDAKPGSYDLAPIAICSQYPVVTSQVVSSGTKDKCFTIQQASIYIAKRIVIRDDSYTDAATFKTAMSGVQMVYELTEPQTIQPTPQELKLLKGTNNISTNGTTINLGYQPDNVIGEVKGEIEKCAVDVEFMQFTDGTDTFTDVNLSLDASFHAVSVVGSKIEQKRFICLEVMDKRGGVLQGILASCIAFTDGAKTPSGTAFRAYIESLQMYVNFRIYGSGGSYTLAYQSESSFSASAFYVRVRLMNNL